ncbi:hypothetical protein F66182_16306, partial [Fusarium sp. NRRL 66182]
MFEPLVVSSLLHHRDEKSKTFSVFLRDFYQNTKVCVRIERVRDAQ